MWTLQTSWLRRTVQLGNQSSGTKKCSFLLDVVHVNTFLVYKEIGGTDTFLSCRQLLVKEILELRAQHSPVYRSRGRPSRLPGPGRLIGRQFPVEMTPTPKRARKYKRCDVCSRNALRKETKFMCDICEVPLCAAPCFKIYHT